MNPPDERCWRITDYAGYKLACFFAKGHDGPCSWEMLTHDAELSDYGIVLRELEKESETAASASRGRELEMPSQQTAESRGE